MARWRGILGSVVDVFREAAARFSRHRCSTLGAAVAFQSLLALAPLLVLAVAIAAFVMGEGQARQEALGAARQALGPKGAALAESWLDSARSFGVGATALGSLLFLFGAARLVAELDVALGVVMDPRAVEEQPPPMGTRQKVVATVRQRAWTTLLALALGLWIAGSLASRRALELLWPGEAGMALARTTISWGSLLLALVAAYRYLPSRRLRWGQALLASLITSSLLLVGAYLLELWFTRASVGVGYGATGSVVAVLLWLYTAAQIFLFGAEVSAVALERRGLEFTARAPLPRSGVA